MRNTTKMVFMLSLVAALAASGYLLSCTSCSDGKARTGEGSKISILFTSYLSGEYGPCG